MIALFVTLSCLPLLVIDMLGSSSGASETNSTASALPAPSLVMLATPSTAAAPASVVLETTTVPPPALDATVPAAPVPTTSAPRIVQAPPTTAAPVYLPPPPPPIVSSTDAAFMACIRHRESRGDYTAVDPSGQFMGAYQIYQGGWDSIARSMGREDLVGVRPHEASVADQDAVAYAMLAKLGRAPWNFACS